MAICC